MADDPHPLDDYLPEWASVRAKGDYTLFGAALPTRDGRRTGNAVCCGAVTSLNSEATFLVITDAGNTLRLMVTEMEELFYPPEFVMLNLLPAHRKAMVEEPL